MAYNFGAKDCLCKESSSSEAITTVPCLVFGVMLRSGTAAGSVILKDGGSSGTEIFHLTTAATTAAGDNIQYIEFPKPLKCATSLYATLAGTGAISEVFYNS